jgi:hypothetical protein
MTTGFINVPVPFPGTAEEKAANFNTHHFVTDNGADYSCMFCDSKTWHKAAEYPCGAEVPRHDIPMGES